MVEVTELVSVKPLEWRNGCASTPIGDYLVVEEDWDDEPFWFIIFNGKPLNKLGEHKDEASAIAAAQADYESRILSALTTEPGAPEQAQWRPIETAPKDGTRVDLWQQGHRVTDAFWDEGEEWWCIDSLYSDGEPCPLAVSPEPTHWRPLPAPPKAGD